MNRNAIIRILITLLISFVYYYLVLPPINIHSFSFLFFVVFVLGVYIFTGTINVVTIIKNKTFKSDKLFGTTKIILIIIGLIIVMPMIINFVLSPVFLSKSYSKRIVIEEGVFSEDVSLVNFNSVPLLDKVSSMKLGDRVMGQMPELVSQFDVSNMYTQVTYNDNIVRVTPLEYSDFFKYLSNRKHGVKGYIVVDSNNGESALVKLDKGMKYLDSAIMSYDLNRHIRFNYPTKIFGEKTFEIDNDGKPYFVIPTIKYIGVELKRRVEGVVILDPISGDTNYYDVNSVPSWVDHVYSAELIKEEVNNWGMYKNGFLNSIFGQKDVVATTEGYNYISIDNAIYMYTGITSVVSDESNLGFILTNLRTKETNIYYVPGAEEFSAMASAEGQVQQMKYTATFPILVNLNNKPTYLISLKDNAGLVKMYAFVDVVDYQNVVVTDSSKGIEYAANEYLKGNSDKGDVINTKVIRVQKIDMAVIDNNSYYYIIDSEGDKYRVNIRVNEDILPFMTSGDEIEIGYGMESEITEILSIK